MGAFRILVVVAALTAAIPVAAQQPAPVTDTRAAYDAAFEETLRKPADPPTLLRYAELAVQIGNLEGAISALERLLLIDDDQPKIKLELGVLYYRLGSYEAARGYLESARSSSRASAETKERTDQFLKEIDSKSSKSQFSGDLLFGIGYSTNANTGPAGAIQSFGATVVPTPTVSGRPDFNVIGAGTLRHRYDLGRQDDGTLESDLAFYGSRQFQVSEANVYLFDFTTGPRTSPFEDGLLSDMTVKPFFTGRYVSVNNQPSYWAWGAGMEATTPLGPQINSALTVFGRRRAFLNNPDAPFNDLSSGNEAVAVLDFRVELTSYMTLSLNSAFTRFIADADFESYTEFGVGGAMQVRFTDPLGINGRTWSATASGSTTQAAYDAPDPTVNPFIARNQFDVNLGFVLLVPLTDRLTLVGQTNYTRRTASLSNYAYDAFTTLVGIGWRF
ncbi:tetratricopeptide repeat protein [Reyranella sp.]|uniref:tetratricopeptide repeat protein n=1 Tax=Reyranella sp. TaxID=1929291 RepID=UPI002730EED9|nr:tetratricopeptide repeat protein [Reyranella sp.]MDP2374555.1 tetratricopeptide repeat protein [Reyranella sp.]